MTTPTLTPHAERPEQQQLGQLTFEHAFNAEAVAELAAQQVTNAVEAAALEHESVSLGVAGGRAATRAYELMADQGADLSTAIVYAVDERHTSKTKDLNWTTIGESMSRMGVTPDNQLVPSRDTGVITAASRYAYTLERDLPQDNDGGPRLDVTVLSMGEDGHVASLFPDNHENKTQSFVTASGRTTWVENSPKAPPQRISASYETLARSKLLYLLVSGEGKRDAFKLLETQLADNDIPEEQLLPAARVIRDVRAMGGNVTIIVDDDARLTSSERSAEFDQEFEAWKAKSREAAAAAGMLSMYEETAEPTYLSDGSSTTARAYANQRLSEIVGEAVDPELQPVAPPEAFQKYLFTLQGQIEKEDRMNYREYARRVWGKYVSVADWTRQFTQFPAFQRFERQMIQGLHEIDMTTMVTPGFETVVPEIVRRFPNLAGLTVWSNGDSTVTGYQHAKIGPVLEQLETTLGEIHGSDGDAFFHEIVRDDKFKDGLIPYVEEQLAGRSAEAGPLKIVMIEDSVKNLEKSRKLLAEYGDRVELVPVWFTGSREGLEAQEKVDSLYARYLTAIKDKEPQETGINARYKAFAAARDALRAQRETLNAVASFDQLLGNPTIAGTLAEEDVHLLFDFDGVIGDNIRMRAEQASVIYGALVSAAAEATGMTKAELDELFESIATASK